MCGFDQLYVKNLMQYVGNMDFFKDLLIFNSFNKLNWFATHALNDEYFLNIIIKLKYNEDFRLKQIPS